MRLLTLLFSIFTLIACGNEVEKQTAQKEESPGQEYIQKGRKIVNATQAELLKNVSRAIQEGGPQYAIEYCNLRALSLKDSLSRLHNCQIKRISTKYRNPADKPQSETEIAQLTGYEAAHKNGAALEPGVYVFDNRIEYYQPITIGMETCLRCHGEPGKDIAEATLEKINALYPEDLATGYALDDFRGAWKITFEK